MKFIKLTEPDGTRLLINPHHVAWVSTTNKKDGLKTIILFANGEDSLIVNLPLKEVERAMFDI